LRMPTYAICICIDGHVCWHSNRRLPCQPWKTNYCFPFSFAANKRKFSVLVCRKQTEVFCFSLQQTNGSCRFPLVPFSIYIYEYIYIEMAAYTYIHMENRSIYICICCRFKNGKQRPWAIFLNPFTICLSCKRKLVVCQFADEKTNRSYPWANGLNRLPTVYLCAYIHICLPVCMCMCIFCMYMYVYIQSSCYFYVTLPIPNIG
jgi:hypothetical protein